MRTILASEIGDDITKGIVVDVLLWLNVLPFLAIGRRGLPKLVGVAQDLHITRVVRLWRIRGSAKVMFACLLGQLVQLSRSKRSC